MTWHHARDVRRWTGIDLPIVISQRAFGLRDGVEQSTMPRSARGGEVLAAVLACLSACGEGTAGGSGEAAVLTSQKAAAATNSSVLVALAAPKPNVFALLARSSIVVREDARVSGGDVGVSGQAGSVLLERRSVVGDLSTDKLVDRGGTHGTVTSSAGVPAGPAVERAVPGTEPITVARREVRTICPGAYGEVIVKHGATLRLIGGAYDFLAVRLHAGSRIEALGPVMIRIAGKLDAHERSYVGPAPGSGLTAKGVRVAVLGAAARCARDEDDGERHRAGAAAVIGAKSEVRALMAVPSGILVLGPKLKATGAFFAASIEIRPHALVAFEDGFAAWESALPLTCEDGNACTVDTCSAGACQYTPASVGSSCSDGNACNGVETCDSAGACRLGTPPIVDDGNPCTADSCDPALGVQHVPVPVGASCSDGNACNGEEICDGSGGCLTGTPPIVDDGNSCTADSCDPLLGVVHVSMSAGASCSDGDACNGIELCDGGSVCLAGTPPALDDGHSCTADACDPVLGVVHAPLPTGSACSDGNVCNGAETCDGAGLCLAGTPLPVDDGNPCTADACDPVQGVTHGLVAAGTACSDGNACNGLETCNGAGTCTAGAAPVIDDGDPCTIDSCDAVAGVTHTPIPSCTVMHGRVKGRDGNPIGGVSVTVLNQPEIAGALTGGDGTFAIAMSASASFTLSYQREGYPEVQRKVSEMPLTTEEVVLVPYDTKVTAITSGAAQTQVARGSPTTDSSGTRQATILFLPRTSASLVIGDTTSQTVTDAFHVRATEYTVGPDWLTALPAIPSTSDNYSYVVELSLDEAVSAGAQAVRFSQPAALYVEDFLGFPVGTPLSVAYYDRVRSTWVSENSGQVVAITAVNAEQADLDVNGDGLVDDERILTAAGIGSGERRELASLYQPGATLWRVPLQHLTPIAIGRVQLASCGGTVGTSCSDGNACNGSEVCDGAANCLASVPPTVDDGNPCTIDSCDPTLGVIHMLAPVGASCSDGNACNGAETCDGAGACAAGTPPSVDDGNPCTADACYQATGIVHTPIPGCDAPPLMLTISAPPQGFSITSPLILVNGSIVGGAPPFTVRVNGNAVQTSSEQIFSAAIELGVGAATISVTVTDASGTAAQQQISGQRTEGDGDGSSGPGETVPPRTVFTYDAAGNLTGIINTRSDVNNCGSVGTVCRGTAHGTAACLDGACAVTSGGQPINVSTDPANCGDVGSVCPATVGKGTPTCGNGVCGFECVQGYVPAAGRCVDLTTDTANCGAVGHICTGTGTTIPLCNAGACGTTGTPIVYTVNGITPPGQQFGAPLWAGIHLEGENLQNVTYIEVEDWGPDTMGSEPNGVESVPMFTGWAGIMDEPWYESTSATLDISGFAIERFASWREWQKLRLHYVEGGSDRTIFVDIAVSLDNTAPVTMPPPQITAVDTIRYLRMGDDGTGDTGDYDPATGFIPTESDLTTFTPRPTAVINPWEPYREYPILKITPRGVYIVAGRSRHEVSMAAIEFSHSEDIGWGMGFVFPYSSAPGDRVHIARHSGEYSGTDDAVILRGSGLYQDGPVVPSNPVGTPLTDDFYSAFFGDRIIHWGDTDGDPDAFLEFDSARGTAATPWPLRWAGAPVALLIDGARRYGQTIVITGRWLGDVRTVALEGVQQRFRIVDNRHLEVSLSSGYRSCDRWNGLAGLVISNPEGAAWLGFQMVNSLPACTDSSDNSSPAPTPPPTGSTTIPGGPPFPGVGGDCTNGFCE
jgi:hypothetical protein